jgi:hypothetical protein
MRRVLTWLVVTLGIAALVRKLRRPKAAQPGQQPPPATEVVPDPADELRRKLAENRPDEEPPATPAGEAVDASVQERRDAVYEQGRSTLDEMQDTSEH